MAATLAPPSPAAPAGVPAEAAVPSVAPRERLLSLDVFRGMTVAGMLLVNDPGSWAHIYAPLEHAEWHGWTPTDLIFPFFLFIVGITTQLSLGARRAAGAGDAEILRQVVRRGQRLDPVQVRPAFRSARHRGDDPAGAVTRIEAARAGR